MIDIILASFIAALICHAIDVLMSKGNLLYFIRYNLYNKKVNRINDICTEKRNDIIAKCNLSQSDINKYFNQVDEYNNKQLQKLFYLKPFVSCVICFASTYGLLTLIYLYSLGIIALSYIPISLFITVIYNDIIYDIRKAIQK